MTLSEEKNTEKITFNKQSIAELADKRRYLYLVEKMQRGALTRSEIAEVRRYEAGPLPDTIVKTAEEAAKVMEVTYRTVQRWKREGMPVTKEGFYDLEEIKAWHLSRIEKGKRAKGKDFWDEKISKFKAGLLELELLETSGMLLPKEEVEQERINRIMAVKRTFLALPTRMAPILAMKEPREIEALLYEALGEIIDEFAGAKKDEQNKALDKEARPVGLDSGREAGLEAAGEDKR
jgi:phage terminase Nu1 subunit (DNA packaging protein)